VAVLTSFLRKKGFYVDQDDLNQKINNGPLRRKINFKLFSDYDRALKYACGEEDKELDTFADSILNETKLEDFDIFLLSFSNIPPNFALEDLIPLYIISRRLKTHFSKPIVVGGGLFGKESGLKHKVYEAIKKNFFDYYILEGGGVLSAFQLICTLNKDRCLKSVGRLVYLCKGKVIENKQKYKPILIKPDFKGLPLDLYRWNTSKNQKGKSQEGLLILPFRFIYGCCYNCAFCMNSSPKNFFALPPKTVALYLKELSEEYNTKYFFFLNSLINPSKRYMNKFCDAIINLNIDILWTASARASDLDKKTIQKMRKAGCIRLVFGVESASQRLLDYSEKNLNILISKRIIKQCSDAGIWVITNFIAGLPSETDKDIKTTMNFISENKDFIDQVSVAPFWLIDSCRFFLYPKKYGIQNIKPAPWYESYGLSGSQLRFIPSPYHFDEKKGLLWKEKVKQIFTSFCLLKNTSSTVGREFFYEQLPLLFHLYSIHSDKKIIKQEYIRESKIILRRFVIKHPFKLFNGVLLSLKFKLLSRGINSFRKE